MRLKAYDNSPMQTILDQLKTDTPLWKKFECPSTHRDTAVITAVKTAYGVDIIGLQLKKKGK